MAEPIQLRKLGNEFLILMDDGTRRRALELPGEMWTIKGDPPPVVVPPPNPTTRFVWPAPLSRVTYEFRPPSRPTHMGMDFAGGEAGNGQPMKASSPGTVYVAGTHGGYGNTVVLDHGGGLFTLYGHMQWGSLTVSKGDTVEQNQTLGKIGQTGQSYGAHIHFETHEGGYRWNDSAVNPRGFFEKYNV